LGPRGSSVAPLVHCTRKICRQNLIQKRKKKKAKGCKLQRDEQMSSEMLRKK